jgi:hypothetical protein
MQEELKKLAGMPPLDQRDWVSFLEAVTGEYQQLHAADQWPAPVYELYSKDTPQPRSTELIEALQFFNMTGHTAIILDGTPWLQKMPWGPDPRAGSDPRNPQGHTAVLLVF